MWVIIFLQCKLWSVGDRDDPHTHTRNESHFYLWLKFHPLTAKPQLPQVSETPKTQCFGYWFDRHENAVRQKLMKPSMGLWLKALPRLQVALPARCKFIQNPPNRWERLKMKQSQISACTPESVQSSHSLNTTSQSEPIGSQNPPTHHSKWKRTLQHLQENRYLELTAAIDVVPEAVAPLRKMKTP